jgi:RES domain-containing protein
VSAPWLTSAWCSGPSGPDLDVEELTTVDGNRWSRRGERTIYLAGDPGVALAELGRHWDEGKRDVHIWRMRLSLDAAVDLRTETARATFGLPEDPAWILDTERCRALASALRADARYDGMIVPSAAFLDDRARWNAVVFVERAWRPLSLIIKVEGRAITFGPAAD